MIRIAAFAFTIWSLAFGPATAQPAPPAPKVLPAVSSLIDQFRTHPLVGLGDYHGLAQELDFYAALVREPRFADEVGNLVVEFGAISQPIIDRYVSGEDVPYAELRKVWSDSVGWVPTGTYVGFQNLFAQVRAVNAGLPPQKRIRIWLADPKIEWKKIHTNKDWAALVRTRGAHAAQLIEEQIIAKGRKALVIYGGGHFKTDGGESMKSQRELVDERHPGLFHIVLPYTGFVEKSCAVKLEERFRDWQVPAIASPVRGTWLENALQPEGCTIIQPDTNINTGYTPEQLARILKSQIDNLSGVGGHALLYLGPASTLTLSQKSPDIYMDDAFRAEMSRRYQIIMGKPLTTATAKENPVSPRPLRP